MSSVGGCVGVRGVLPPTPAADRGWTRSATLRKHTINPLIRDHHVLLAEICHSIEEK